MGGQRTTFTGILIFGAAIILLLQGANAATNYTVGGSLGWTVPSSNSIGYYENWASNHTFQIGDFLVFNLNGTHTATEVENQEQYDNCTKTGAVIKSSGAVLIPLGKNGTRYFVCSVGNHCEQDMKVAIKVGNGIAPPSLPPSAAPSLTMAASSLAAAVSSLLIFIFSTT